MANEEVQEDQENNESVEKEEAVNAEDDSYRKNCFFGR